MFRECSEWSQNRQKEGVPSVPSALVNRSGGTPAKLGATLCSYAPKALGLQVTRNGTTPDRPRAGISGKVSNARECRAIAIAKSLTNAASAPHSMDAVFAHGTDTPIAPCKKSTHNSLETKGRAPACTAVLGHREACGGRFRLARRPALPAKTYEPKGGRKPFSSLQLFSRLFGFFSGPVWIFGLGWLKRLSSGRCEGVRESHHGLSGMPE